MSQVAVIVVAIEVCRFHFLVNFVSYRLAVVVEVVQMNLYGVATSGAL